MKYCRKLIILEVSVLTLRPRLLRACREPTVVLALVGAHVRSQRDATWMVSHWALSADGVCPHWIAPKPKQRPLAMTLLSPGHHHLLVGSPQPALYSTLCLQALHSRQFFVSLLAPWFWWPVTQMCFLTPSLHLPPSTLLPGWQAPSPLQDSKGALGQSACSLGVFIPGPSQGGSPGQPTIQNEELRPGGWAHATERRMKESTCQENEACYSFTPAGHC